MSLDRRELRSARSLQLGGTSYAHVGFRFHLRESPRLGAGRGDGFQEAGPLAAILAAAGTAGEFRHRTAAATFLAEPRRARVITAKLITYLLAGARYALACVAVSLAVALPWLAARGTPVSWPATGTSRSWVP